MELSSKLQRRLRVLSRINFTALYSLYVAAVFLGLTLPASGQIMSVRSQDHYDISPAVRDLPTVADSQTSKHEAEPLRLIPLPPNLKRPQDPDLALQSPTSAGSGSLLTPSVGLGFDGIGQGVFGFNVSVAPPDTNGAVGLNQYVQWVNVSFAVFNKATGALIKGPVAGNSLWQGFGGGCETNNNGDPIVVYDKLANRWV